MLQPAVKVARYDLPDLAAGRPLVTGESGLVDRTCVATPADVTAPTDTGSTASGKVRIGTSQSTMNTIRFFILVSSPRVAGVTDGVDPALGLKVAPRIKFTRIDSLERLHPADRDRFDHQRIEGSCLRREWSELVSLAPLRLLDLSSLRSRLPAPAGPRRRNRSRSPDRFRGFQEARSS